MCNMKIYFTLLASLLSLLVGAQDTLFFENFQNQNLGSFTTIDNDGLPLHDDFVGFGGAFMATPVSSPSELRAVSVSAFTSAGDADNWLISPAIQIVNSGTQLKWTASSLSGEIDKLEEYSVLLSTSGQAIENFDVTLLDISAENPFQTDREVDLSAYAGQNVYIAFNQIGSDNYALTLDDIAVIGPARANDVVLLDIVGDRYQNLDDRGLFLEVVNVGNNTIMDLTAAGSINGNSGENTFSNLNILPQDTAYIPFAELFPFEADKYEIITSLTGVNGENISGDELSKIVFMVENAPTKRLLFEEMTSTTCGWCPEGIVQKELMKFKYPQEVINISVHTDDPMRNVLYDLGLQTAPGFGGVPSAIINRKTFLTHDRVEPHYLQDFSRVAPLTMEIEQAYNEETREIELTVSSVAHTTIDDKIHSYSFVILEDKVTGSSPEFAQANNYSSEASDISLVGVDGVDWKTRSNPVPESLMTYDDVVRDVIGGFEGIENSVANSTSGQALSYSENYTLSSAFDENEIWIVALALDMETGEVINAVEQPLLLDSEVNDLEIVKGLKIYPNPAVDYIDVQIQSLENQKIVLHISNVLGQELYKLEDQLEIGENSLRIQLDGIQSGPHFLHILTTNGKVSKSLTILDR